MWIHFEAQSILKVLIRLVSKTDNVIHFTRSVKQVSVDLVLDHYKFNLSFFGNN